MKKTVIASALALALVSSPAFAKGNPHGRDKKEEKHHGRDHSSHDSGRPAGWDKGKKKGWGDCDVPPGQAKKVGCNSHNTHVSHRRREHRPVVTTHHRSYPRSTRYPRGTTTTTTTTTRTTSATKGTHPFTPVLREKQQRGTGGTTGPKQSTK